MVLSFEDAHAALYAPLAEGREELDALGERAAVVLLAVDEERGRLHMVRIAQRAVGPDLQKVAVRGDPRAALVLREDRADIGDAVHGDPAGDARRIHITVQDIFGCS